MLLTRDSHFSKQVYVNAELRRDGEESKIIKTTDVDGAME
jgi:hypothetical protein